MRLVPYFNVTPFGLQYLCRALDIVETSLLGTYAEVVTWIAVEADVTPPRLIPAPTPDRYFNVASGCALLGRKP